MRILVPIDGSETSFNALEFGLEMAARFGGDLHVVHFSDTETAATDDILERARDTVADAPLDDTPEIELVDMEVWTDAGVGKAIVDFVTEQGYDHVVMGHHGSGAVGRAILGSAAETVIRAETVPVTVVP